MEGNCVSKCNLSLPHKFAGTASFSMYSAVSAQRRTPHNRSKSAWRRRRIFKVRVGDDTTATCKLDRGQWGEIKK